jgi:transaldolase
MTSEWHAMREKLLFKTPAKAFAQECERVRRHYAEEFDQANAERRNEIIGILTEISIDMQSYLTRWHLQDPENPDRLQCEEIRKQAEQNYALLTAWGQKDKVESVKSAITTINRSNLLKVSRMADRRVINSRWGNDGATGLTDAIRKGAVLATTNPIIVNAVRKEAPEIWDRVRDELMRAYPDSPPEKRVSLMTMAVVLRNCREFRPIYQATGGTFGYVKLQVNPRASHDSIRMAEEAEDLYERLKRELNGNPNVVFKIPGVRAGLDSVRRLTSKGIPCTVTVNFSVAQNLAFAEVIEQGCAPLSFLVVMSGRLEDPIREELNQLGLPDAAEVARWAGIAVIRRSYDILYRQRKYKRSAILTASLRGPWNIDGSITNEEAPVFITCFPDKAIEYDSVEREVESHINERIPDEPMAKLMKTRIFPQAYEVAGLTRDQFDFFPPVVATMTAFTRAYDEFLEYNR